jgi:pyruvate dehydrogenase E1 component beta subunit
MAKITMREAISQALMEEMDRDPPSLSSARRSVSGAAPMPSPRVFTTSTDPNASSDTPIAENAIIGAAIGAAMVGQRPIAELMTINFAFSAMDYIVNQAPKLRYMFGGQFSVPMVIRAVGGGGRQLGATHSQTPDAIFAHFPGLKVCQPRDAGRCQGIAEIGHSVG